MTEKSALRLIYAISASRNFFLQNIDFRAAFLRERFTHKNPVYVHQHPRFYGTMKYPRCAGQLDGNLYGTRQGGYLYFAGAKLKLAQLGFTRPKSEPCVLFKHLGPTHFIIVAACIDDSLSQLHITSCIHNYVNNLQKSIR